MSITERVATLRRLQGTPARAVAASSGVHTSNIYAIEHGRRQPSAVTLERIANACGIQLVAADTRGIPTTTETASRLAAHAAEEDEAGAYRQLIQIADDLASATPTEAVLLTYERPGSISVGWDAAIAGIVEWRLTQRHLPLPPWVAAESAAPAAPWEPLPTPYKIDPDRVPPALRRRNVWVESDELGSA